MNVIISKFDRESICATCLSQDRKLFAVSDLHATNSVQQAKFYSELSLTWTDKVCWECHHAVRKMVAFKDKAQRAQAWLWSTTDSQQCEIQCLSSLSISKGTFFNITGPELHEEPKPMVFVTVKQESFDEDAFHESMSSVEKAEVNESVDVDNHNGVRIKEEEIKKFVICVPKVRERKRKLPTPEAKPATETQVDCTAEALTEDGLIKWREKKRKIDFFAQCIPLERCEKCIQPFESPLAAKIHERKHTELYGDVECDICTQRLVQKAELVVHKKLHYRVLKCNQCAFEWDDMNTMRQHWSDVHGVTQTVWECEPCERRFPNVKKLASHLSSHRRQKCPDCGKAVTEQHLKKHMFQHRGGRPLHACGECGGQFRGEEGLRAHMRTHSTEVDPAAFCTECNIQFRDKTLYRNHLRHTNIHASESDFKYKCEVCGMKFRMSYSLQSHLRVRHSDFVYRCEQCDQTFKTKAGRRVHRENKHEGKVLPRNKLCDYCGRGFTRKGLLASHINTHTGARPFVCKLCGADFGHKSALYLHGRYKHKIQKIKKNDGMKVNRDSTVKDNSGKDISEKVHSENSCEGGDHGRERERKELVK